MSNIIMSEEFLAKAKSAKSFEELKSMVAAEGVEIADNELMNAWERLSESVGKGKFKLSEEELDNVAGGCGKSTPSPKYSKGQILQRQLGGLPENFTIIDYSWRDGTYYYHLTKYDRYTAQWKDAGWYSEWSLDHDFTS